MKKSSTKRALVLSVLALVMCFSMLIGTTYAWFTDSVTSGVNKIIAGNLDIELYHDDGKTSDYVKVDANTKLFDDIALWEPGAVVYENFKVENKGTLALKYVLSFVAENATEVNGASIVDALKIAVVEDGFSGDRDKAKALTNYVDFESFNLAGELLNKDATKVYGIVIYWEPTLDDNKFNMNNENQGKALTVDLGVKLLATQLTYENDSFDEFYDKNTVIATTAAEAQAALDNAEKGTLIKLAPGVDYGTLYFRAIPNVTPNTVYFGNGGDGNRDGYRRTLENIAIIGSDSATVDAILFEDGAVTDNRSSRFTVKNLLIKGITFTAEGGADYNYSQDGEQFFDDQDRPAILLRLNNISFDGITIEDCTRVGECNYNFVRTYGHSADATDNSLAKNLTITGCIIDSNRRLCSLYPCENVTITNNTINNTAEHGIHLSGYNTYTYSGNVIITDNIADGTNDRFVRMAGAGNAAVVVKDNTVKNYLGAEGDYIKVTDGTNVTIENNTMTRAYKASNDAELRTAINSARAGETVFLTADINLTSDIAIANANCVLDGDGHTITGTGTHGLFDVTDGIFALKNVTFDGVNGPVIRTVRVKFDATNVVVKNGTSTVQQGLFRLLGENTITNCTFKNNTCNMVITLNYDDVNNDPQVVEGCVFEGNTCNDTAVVYYVTGAGATIKDNKFIGNTVNSNGHGAVLYCEEATVTGNKFDNNSVNAGGARVGVIVLDAGEVSGNAFAGNAFATTFAGTVYKATIVSKGDAGTVLTISNNTASDFANVKGNTVTVQ